MRVQQMNGRDAWFDNNSGGAWRESLYAPHRRAAIEALGDCVGGIVLDVACGDGGNLDHWRLGSDRAPAWVMGVDHRMGKLREARQKVRQGGWKNVVLLQLEPHTLERASLDEYLQGRQVDGVLCTLELTALTQWEEAFARTFSLLKPGGRYAILDRYAGGERERLPLPEVRGDADITRKVWEPLEKVSQDFQMRFFDVSARALGGNLFLATGQRPIV